MCDPATIEFTDDEGRHPWAAPWEFVVEEWINGLHPPAFSPEFVQVGYNGAWLSAVIAGRIYPLDNHCFIAALGVAHRDSGHGLALEALDRVHAVMATHSISRDYIATGFVDPNNDPVRSSLTARGYEHTGEHQGLEVWSQRFGDRPRRTL